MLGLPLVLQQYLVQLWQYMCNKVAALNNALPFKANLLPFINYFTNWHMTTAAARLCLDVASTLARLPYTTNGMELLHAIFYHMCVARHASLHQML